MLHLPDIKNKGSWGIFSVTTIFLLVLFTVPLAFAQTFTAPDGTEVTIIRDEYGVPHITGETEEALFYAQGFAHARDRLYQMETYWRAGSGRLAEIFGVSQLPSDQEVRIIGYTPEETISQIESLSPELQAMFEVYTQGVNTYLDSIAADPDTYLPYQFQSIPLEPWTVERTMYVIQYMAYQFGVFGGEELTRLMELEANGIEWFDQYRPINNPDAPVTVYGQESGVQQDWEHSVTSVDPSVVESWNALRQAAQQCRSNIGLTHTFGSFAVLIKEERSATSAAMILGCPQMGTPRRNSANTVCEVELQCPDLHVGGMTIAGIPGVIIGRTDEFAWTLTSGISDNTDVYVDSTQTEELVSYWYNDAWQEFEVIPDTIHVANSNDVPITRVRSVHGPVFTTDLADHYAYSVKTSTRNLEIEFFNMFYDVWHASDRAEFAEAISESPYSFNVFYAHRSGELGYWHTGKYQDRTDGVDPRLPHRGDGSEEWQGFIPFEELPRATETDQDFFVNWNNKPVVWWNNGDNVPWTQSYHGVNNIYNFVNPIESFTYENLLDVPAQINSHGTYQQGIAWEDSVRDMNIVPPGQSNFVNTDGVEDPHFADQWPLHLSWEFKEWHYGEDIDDVEEFEHPVPTAFSIEFIYPNPFNPSTTIVFTVAERSELSFRVYDVLGRLVLTLAEGSYETGQHRILYSAENLSSGMYFLRVQTGDGQQQTQNLLLIK